MGLIKAIKHKKEHRKEYIGAKAVDRHCENNGGRRHQWECCYCKSNRMYQIEKEKERIKNILEEQNEIQDK